LQKREESPRLKRKKKEGREDGRNAIVAFHHKGGKNKRSRGKGEGTSPSALESKTARPRRRKTRATYYFQLSRAQ